MQSVVTRGQQRSTGVSIIQVLPPYCQHIDNKEEEHDDKCCTIKIDLNHV